MSKMVSIGMMLQLAALTAMDSNNYLLDDEERRDRRESMDKTNYKSDKDRATQKGLKEFDYTGRKVYAINQKNADKKARKLGYI